MKPIVFFVVVLALRRLRATLRGHSLSVAQPLFRVEAQPRAGTGQKKRSDLGVLWLPLAPHILRWRLLDAYFDFAAFLNTYAF